MATPKLSACPTRRLRVAVLVILCASPSWQAARAASPESGEARAYFDKATASFALGHYAVAAENFEKAFELRPDSALLYNAAQAHRLAGNKERALTLYQNYLRLYAKAVRRTEVEGRVDDLKKAIERDRQLATSPPTTTMPSSLPPGPAVEPATTAAGTPPPSPPAVVPPPSSPPPVAPAPEANRVTPPPAVIDTRPSLAVSSSPSSSPPPPAPVLVAQPEPVDGDHRSLTQKPLFWTAVGGAVAAAVVVVLILALGGPKDPSPSLGTVK